MSSWVSFVTGVMTVILASVLFSIGKDEEIEEESSISNELAVNGPYGRYVTMSCQTCRKLKRHLEIETDLYECLKCKRHIDLRRL